MLGNFSLRDLFYSFDTDVVFYMILFFMIFAMIHFLLKKTMFKESKGILTVLSISSALLAVYGLIRADFSIAALMFQLNLPPLLQYNLVWILFILAFVILWVKFSFSICLIVLGSILLIVGFLQLVYSNAAVGIIGTILLLFGIWLQLKRKKKDNHPEINIKTTNNINVPPQQNGALIKFLGTRGKNKNPKPQRQKSQRELQKKYNYYSKKIQEIQRKNNGRIPKRGTRDEHKRHRYIQAMKAIENSAKKKGFRLK